MVEDDCVLIKRFFMSFPYAAGTGFFCEETFEVGLDAMMVAGDVMGLV